MKPASFEYVRPRDVTEALSVLKKGADRARVIAGGQSLGPMLNFRVARPQLLVDIATLAELRAIEQREGKVRIGAAVTHAEIEDGALAIPQSRFFSAVARGIAYRAVRNRGTLGGSLAHADPHADWPMILALVGGSIVIAGSEGQKTVPADRFATGAFSTVLTPGEIVFAVEIPAIAPKCRLGVFKLCRKIGEFPHASAGVLLDRDSNMSRVFLSALADGPRRLPDLERVLLEAGREGASIAQITRAVADAAPELDLVDRQLFANCLAQAQLRAFQQ
jgi:aerobic carbon-monoxide dehydrogenase medium subunit